jgi:hypothetical protein
MTERAGEQQSLSVEMVLSFLQERFWVVTRMVDKDNAYIYIYNTYIRILRM